MKNWIEILGDPAYRGEDFDQGGRDEITLPVSFLPPRTETIFLRRAFNWAVPGIQIDDLRRFLLGEVDLLELLGESEEFALVSTALGLSDFSVEDFDVLDLATQIGSEAERVVVFIGGNDVNSVYETVYDGDCPGRSSQTSSTTCGSSSTGFSRGTLRFRWCWFPSRTSGSLRMSNRPTRPTRLKPDG